MGKIKEAEFPQMAQRPDSNKTISEAQASTTNNISQKQQNINNDTSIRYSMPLIISMIFHLVI